tara:strand:- start:3754 stop:3903 length:150 start_codon:yes stop_codon:yes gene_type:complete
LSFAVVTVTIFTTITLFVLDGLARLSKTGRKMGSDEMERERERERERAV